MNTKSQTLYDLSTLKPQYGFYGAIGADDARALLSSDETVGAYLLYNVGNEYTLLVNKAGFERYGVRAREAMVAQAVGFTYSNKNQTARIGGTVLKIDLEDVLRNAPKYLLPPAQGFAYHVCKPRIKLIKPLTQYQLEHVRR